MSHLESSPDHSSSPKSTPRRSPDPDHDDPSGGITWKPHRFPAGEYDSSQSAHDALMAHGRQHHYAVGRSGFKPDKKGTTDANKHTFFYRCDRWNTRPSRATKRNSSSRGTGCRVKIAVRALDHRNLRSTRWIIEYVGGCDIHNHGPSYSFKSHALHRRLTEGQEAHIEGLVDSGARPLVVLNHTRNTDPSFVGRSRDVYNLKHKLVQRS
jgi:hypothetical protein